MRGKIITDYYKFVKLPDQKSKHRIDCVQSTMSYPPLEELRAKDDLFLYITDSTYIKSGANRKAGLSLSKNKHITSLYHPRPEKPYYYGDFKDTADALLFIVKGNFVNGAIQEGATVEVFVCRGYRNDREPLYTSFAEGEYHDQIEAIRNESHPEGDESLTMQNRIDYV